MCCVCDACAGRLGRAGRVPRHGVRRGVVRSRLRAAAVAHRLHQRRRAAGLGRAEHRRLTLHQTQLYLSTHTIHKSLPSL